MVIQRHSTIGAKSVRYSFDICDVLGGGEAYELLEYRLEIGARAEAATLGDGVVAPIGMLPQQAFGFFQSEVGEPRAEQLPLGGSEP